MDKLRIAVVSTDGIHVDEHFGRAGRFLIFDIDKTMTPIENRPIEQLSENNPDHPFDADKFSRITAQLKDCSKVYVTQIGDVPAAKLKGLGIKAEIYKGAISDIKK